MWIRIVEGLKPHLRLPSLLLLDHPMTVAVEKSTISSKRIKNLVIFVFWKEKIVPDEYIFMNTIYKDLINIITFLNVKRQIVPVFWILFSFVIRKKLPTPLLRRAKQMKQQYKNANAIDKKNAHPIHIVVYHPIHHIHNTYIIRPSIARYIHFIFLFIHNGRLLIQLERSKHQH